MGNVPSHDEDARAGAVAGQIQIAGDVETLRSPSCPVDVFGLLSFVY